MALECVFGEYYVNAYPSPNQAPPLEEATWLASPSNANWSTDGGLYDSFGGGDEDAIPPEFLVEIHAPLLCLTLHQVTLQDFVQSGLPGLDE